MSRLVLFSVVAEVIDIIFGRNVLPSIAKKELYMLIQISTMQLKMYHLREQRNLIKDPPESRDHSDQSK
jgi:hypothetical protein